MQITTKAIPKLTSQAEAGELISIRLGGRLHLAIVLAIENNHPVLGIVMGFDANWYPFHVELQSGGKCLSFGTGWLLEPIFGPNSWPGNQEFHDTPGVVHMTPEGCMINFGARPEDWRHSTLSFNLEDNSIDHYDGNSAVPVLAWKIWESAAQRDRDGCDPLVQFTFSKPDN